MRHSLTVAFVSGLLVGCSQPAGSSNPKPDAPLGPAARTTTGPAPMVGTDVVATVLGLEIKRSDCVSPGLGIGSVEVGICSLVFNLLMDDWSKSQQLTLSEDEINGYGKARREAAQWARPGKPFTEPEFDEAAVQAKLKVTQDKLGAPDLPLLERLTLQSQVSGLQRGLALKSRAAMSAYEDLLPLRAEEALYKKYGGKVVARQISLQAAGANQKFAEDAQASGKLVFHDESLKQAFWKRLQDDLSHPEVPPEQVDFSLPVWLLVPAKSPPRTSRPVAQPEPAK